MKLPSLHHLYTGFNNVLKRFPVQFIITILAMLGWCYIIQLDNDYSVPHKNELLKMQLIDAEFSLNIALVLIFALDLFSERNHYPALKKWGLRLAALAFCTFVFCVLHPTKYIADAFKIAMLSFAFHLLVSFAPFIGKRDLKGFWQFNKVLFLRILTAALYSAVLFLGLAAALVAIDNLFNVHIRSEWFETIFAVIAVGFNTIFFLAGIPQDVALLNDDNSYPKGLKIFTQFVLIPLMTIYLAILLVYEVKIGITWQMPKGMVSVLILAYAVFGILSLLLIHPIKETEGNNWIKLFSRFFYMMMIPLIVLLILAICKRVGHYGITESRYVLIVLALWLSGITLYFIFSKKENIKMIPITLCIITLLSIYGPQSAFSVSKHSQLARLKKLYKSTNQKDKVEVTEIINYLVKQHGLQSLQPFTQTDLKKVELAIDKRNESDYTLASMKRDTAFAILKFKETFNEPSYKSNYISFTNENTDILNVTGYDFVMDLEKQSNRTLPQSGPKISIDQIENNTAISLKVDDKELIKADLVTLFQEALTSYSKQDTSGNKGNPLDATSLPYATNKMTFTKTKDNWMFTILITSVEGNKDKGDQERDGYWISSHGYLLIKKLR